MSFVTTSPKKIPIHEAAHGVVWTFGGGKGGIGKSFLTTNIAVCLAHMGYTVTLVDLDVGGANLHTCVGAEVPRVGLSDFFQGKVEHAKDLMVESPIQRLKLIGGLNDGFAITKINYQARANLYAQLTQLPTNFVFIDLGAGTSDLNSDFFMMANQSIVVTTPEPTSVENTYQFLRSALYRKLRQVEMALDSKNLFSEVLDQRQTFGIRTPNDLVRHFMKVKPDVGMKIREELDKLRFKLIMNQARTKTDAEMGYSLKMVCRQYFGINLDFTGYLDFDNAVWQSTRKKQPLVLAFPFSHLSGNLFNLAKSLVESKQISAIL